MKSSYLKEHYSTQDCLMKLVQIICKFCGMAYKYWYMANSQRKWQLGFSHILLGKMNAIFIFISHSPQWFYIIFIFLSTVPEVNAQKCYQCVSFDDQDCGSDFNNNGALVTEQSCNQKCFVSMGITHTIKVNNKPK